MKPEELLTLTFGGLAGYAAVDGRWIIAALCPVMAVLSIWVSALLIR